MRNDFFTKLLVGVLALAVLATAVLAYIYVRSAQKLHTLQLQTALINRNRTIVNSLVNEALEYSRRNPAIDPILQSAGIKPKPATSPRQAAPEPAPK